MTATPYFSKDYAAARAKFLDAATAAGATLFHFWNPLRGPAGEKLFTDAAWLGPADATRVLVTISATHGNEGFCGSGIQVGWFSSGLARELPPGMALLAIHAINPHGFAWIRRVTEDNVDLNRNFVDHGGQYPVNAGYIELADAITPAAWTDESRAATKARFDAYSAKHGPMGLQTALSGGQYTHPEGVFFGGHAPTWSNRTLSTIVRRFLAKAKAVAVIDYHTGLGPYGHGELIAATPPSSDAYRRVRAWLGDELTSSELGSSKSAVLNGTNQPGVMRLIPQVAYAGIALEYGTFPLEEVMGALRADNWLNVHGEYDSPQWREIKAQVRRALYPDADDWRELVWERAVDINRRMLRGLAQT